MKRNYVLASVLSLLAFLTIWGNLFYLMPSLIPSDQIVFLILFNVLSLGMLIFSVYQIHAVHYDNKKDIVGAVICAAVVLTVVLSLAVSGGKAELQTHEIVFTVIYGILHLPILGCYIAGAIKNRR